MTFIHFSNLVSLSTTWLRLKYSVYESGFIKEIMSLLLIRLQSLHSANTAEKWDVSTLPAN